MATIIIQSDDNKDISLLKILSEKMGLSAHILTDIEKEDIGLAYAIAENKPNEQMLMEDALAYYQALKKGDNEG